MDYFIVLGNVKYNGKTFVVYLDNRNKYVYLEKCGEKYYLPMVDDLVGLQLAMFVDRRMQNDLREDRPVVKKVLAMTMAAIVGLNGGILVRCLEILNDVPRRITVVVDAEQKSIQSFTHSFVVGAKSLDALGYDRVSYEQVIDVIESREAISEYREDIKKFLDRVVAFDETVDLRVFLFNLQRMNISRVSKSEMDKLSRISANGVFFSGTGDIALRNDSSVITLYHELNHAINLFSDENVVKRFSYTNDEYHGLGEFVLEAGNDYSLYLMGLYDEADISEFYFTERLLNFRMLANVIGDKEIIRLYRDGTVTDLAREISAVLGDEDLTKRMLGLLDLNFEYLRNDIRLDADKIVEMDMDTKVDMYQILSEYMIRGLFSVYEVSGELDSVASKIKDVYYSFDEIWTLKEEYEDGVLLDRVKEDYERKVWEYFEDRIDLNSGYEVEIGEDVLLYRDGKSLNSSEYNLGVGVFVDSRGLAHKGEVLVLKDVNVSKRLSHGDFVLGVNPYTMESVTIRSYTNYCALDHYLVLSRRKYLSDKDMHGEVEELVEKTVRNTDYNAKVLGVLLEVVPNYGEVRGNANVYRSYLQDLGVSSENIEELMKVFTDEEVNAWAFRDMLYQVLAKRFESMDDTMDDYLSYAKLLTALRDYGLVPTYYSSVGDNLDTTQYTRFGNLTDSFFGKLAERAAYKGCSLDDYDVATGVFDGYELTLDGDKVLMVDKYLDEGEFKDVRVEYSIDDIYYAINEDNKLVLCDKSGEVNLFDNLLVDGGLDIVGEFSELVKRPFLEDKLVKRGFVNTSWSDVLYYLGLEGVFGKVDASLKYEMGSYYFNVNVCNNYYSSEASFPVCITDKGPVFVFANVSDGLIPSNKFYDFFTGMMISEDLVVLSEMSIGEYLQASGVSMDEGEEVLISELLMPKMRVG